MALAESMIDDVEKLDANTCNAIMGQLAIAIQSNSVLQEQGVLESVQHILKMIALAKIKMQQNIEPIDNLIHTLTDHTKDKQIKQDIRAFKKSIILTSTEEKDSGASIQLLIGLIQKFNSKKNKLSAKFKKNSDFNPHVALLEIWEAIILIPITNLKIRDDKKRAEEKHHETIRELVQQGIKAALQTKPKEEQTDIPAPPGTSSEGDIPLAPDFTLSENKIPEAPLSVPVLLPAPSNNHSFALTTAMLTHKLNPVKKEETKPLPPATDSAEATGHQKVMQAILMIKPDEEKRAALARKIEDNINAKKQPQNNVAVPVLTAAPARATIPQTKKQPRLSIIADSNPTSNLEYKRLDQADPEILFAVVFPEKKPNQSQKEQEPTIYAYSNLTRPITKTVFNEHHECDKLIRKWIIGKDNQAINSDALNKETDLVRQLNLNMVTVGGANDLLSEVKIGVKLRHVSPKPRAEINVEKVESVTTPSLDSADKTINTHQDDVSILAQPAEEKDPLPLLKTAVTSAKTAYKQQHANRGWLGGLHFSSRKITYHGSAGFDSADALEKSINGASKINEAEDFLGTHFAKKAKEDDVSFSYFIMIAIRGEPLLLKHFKITQGDGLEKLKEYFSGEQPVPPGTPRSLSRTSTIHNHSCD